jgi:predicted XRE-type DNA-binding protein
MTSIITGDIINSRTSNTGKWMDGLKSVLNREGLNPQAWEIFRGDSFQVEIKNPKDALYRAIQIKAAIKQQKKVDVRMCIGIGDKSYESERLTESNGTAFVHSGQGFEELKKNKQTLSIVTGDDAFDSEMNLLIRLILIVMDNWTPAVAEYVTISLRGGLLQEQIAGLLNISQSSVSERNQRSYISEIKEVDSWYRDKIFAHKLG